MATEAEVKIQSIALLILLKVGEKNRNPYASDALVRWSMLDALADAFREAGVQDIPENLGKAAADKKREAIERGSIENEKRREEIFGKQLEVEL